MIDFKAKSNRKSNSKDKFKSVRNYRRNKVAGGISRFIQSYVGKPFGLMLSELAKRLRQSNLE